MIIDVYHVPQLGANMWYVPQLTQTRKKVQFFLDKLVVKDMNNIFFVIVQGILNPKDTLCKFCEFKDLKKEFVPFSLKTNTNDRSRILHERLGKMNFRSMKLMA